MINLCEKHPGLCFEGEGFSCPACWRDDIILEKDKEMHDFLGKDAYDIVAECRDKNRYTKSNYAMYKHHQDNDTAEIARLRRRVDELKKEITEFKEEK